MPNSSVLRIDLDVIESNIRRIKQKGRVMAMVKADAYGMGAIRLIPYLKEFGVSILGVSHVNEGVALREAGIEMPIFVLSAPPFEAAKVAKYRLQPAVSSIEEVAALNECANERIAVHLHVDTGMNRFGIAPENAPGLVNAIREAPCLHLEGIMTHFTSADLPEMDAETHRQILLFKKVVDSLNPLPPWIHAANGPGIRFSIPFCNLIRVGLPLFESALTLESPLSFIKQAKKGEKVGYHCAYTLKRDTPIGVIPLGYYDGVHRHYKEKGYVLIHGKRAPMIGNICMDFLMLDLSAVPEAKIGDSVTLFNQTTLRPESLAAWGNTDVRELLVSIGPRTKRIYIRKKDEQRLPSPICTIEENAPSGEYLLPT
ncbi:MAG: alanine racemase [Chlamydiales bacterium]|nr:alanine racemase [Chlamydiales bacterium]